FLHFGVGFRPSGACGVDDAAAEVFGEQAERHRLQRLRRRADLSEDVDAVLVLIDHLRDTADLPLDAAQPPQVLALVLAIAVHSASSQFTRASIPLEGILTTGHDGWY